MILLYLPQAIDLIVIILMINSIAKHSKGIKRINWIQ